VGNRWRWSDSVLCLVRDAQSVLPSILAMEGCLAQLVLTSLLSQQLLSRAGALGVVFSQLFLQCLRCLAAHDVDQIRSSEPASPRSSATSSCLSADPLANGPGPSIWWHIFGARTWPPSVSYGYHFSTAII
jgi:hypothetical protein